MPTPIAKNFIQNMLANIDITINGTKPWDIQIHNEHFYNRVMQHGALGLGESYMDKWWDCQELDVLFTKILQSQLDEKIKMPFHFKFKQLLAMLTNMQTKQRAKKVAQEHYDLGNDLFAAMLDKRLVYSCGYWQNVQSLDNAQVAKLDLICRKLYLKPGMTLLDIGCGWGGLAKHAAENYGVKVTGITISQQQYDYAKEICQGLPVEIKLQDYRDIPTKFDRIASVGMFEHVGHKNYPQFMQVAYNALNNDGLFLLHTIGTNQSLALANEWMTRYIFPNGALPSVVHLSKASETYFIIEDLHNFGAYYDPTLMAWYHNFINNWQQLQKNYSDRFYRMWNYYLLSCAASFRSRKNQLWQIVFSKNGVRDGYLTIR